MRLRDGEILKTPKDIHLGAVNYIQNFLKARPQRDLPNLSEYVNMEVLDQENLTLAKPPTS